jgi:hypothetical protein
MLSPLEEGSFHGDGRQLENVLAASREIQQHLQLEQTRAWIERRQKEMRERAQTPVYAGSDGDLRTTSPLTHQKLESYPRPPHIMVLENVRRPG